ncbi:MAG: biotin--[acetyl-CoA-carboxylase] ligase, partial [Lachnospiraceae bacterium]|nr:biotin--[acetyl-CoA-carboxylase] ligase [Lachnospiraceae bacterium]
VVSGKQTGGRGRRGRSFFSPKGTGIYLSFIFSPDMKDFNPGEVTCRAAVAACLAIEACLDVKPKIKWVNDIYVDDRKVAGILTEARVDFETGVPTRVVVGIGFNVYVPEGGFPEELSQVAVALTDTKSFNLRARIGAEFISLFRKFTDSQDKEFVLSKYRERSFLEGKEIMVLSGDDKRPAVAGGIGDDFSLEVTYENKETERLTAGEVSIVPKKGNVTK